MKSRGPLRLFLFAYYLPSFHCIFYQCPIDIRYSSSDDDDDDERVAKSAATNSPGLEEDFLSSLAPILEPHGASGCPAGKYTQYTQCFDPKDDDDDDRVAKSAARIGEDLPPPVAPIPEAQGGSSFLDEYTDCFNDGVKMPTAIKRTLPSSPPDPSTQANEAAAAQLQPYGRSAVAALNTESILHPRSARPLDGGGAGNSEERPKPSDFLTLSGVFAALLISIPARGMVESRLLVLYYAHIILLGFALFLGIGLYVSYLCDDDDRGVGHHRRDMKGWKMTTLTAALFLLAVSITLRVLISLPAAATKYVLPPYLGGAVGLVLVTLYWLLRKKAGASTAGQAPGRIDI